MVHARGAGAGVGHYGAELTADAVAVAVGVGGAGAAGLLAVVAQALVVADLVAEGERQAGVARVGAGDAEGPRGLAIALRPVEIGDAAVPGLRGEHGHQVGAVVVAPAVDLVVVAVADAAQPRQRRAHVARLRLRHLGHVHQVELQGGLAVLVRLVDGLDVAHDRRLGGGGAAVARGHLAGVDHHHVLHHRRLRPLCAAAPGLAGGVGQQRVGRRRGAPRVEPEQLIQAGAHRLQAPVVLTVVDEAAQHAVALGDGDHAAGGVAQRTDPGDRVPVGGDELALALGHQRAEARCGEVPGDRTQRIAVGEPQPQAAAGDSLRRQVAVGHRAHELEQQRGLAEVVVGVIGTRRRERGQRQQQAGAGRQGQE